MKKRMLIVCSLFFLLKSQLAIASSPKIEDFLSLPSMLAASTSPDGQYIAGVMGLDDMRTVIVYDIENNKVVSKFGDNIIRPYGVTWANNSRLLIKFLVPYRADKVREDSLEKKDFDINDYFMFARLVSSNIKGGDVVGLFNDQRSVKSNVNLVSVTDYLVDDKEHILMSAFNKGKITLYKINIYLSLNLN